MNQYRIEGNHGWSKTLWCYAKEAVDLWEKAGKGARLFLVTDDAAILLRPVPAPKPYVEPPAPQAEPEEEEAEADADESYNHPVRSWFATPSW